MAVLREDSRTGMFTRCSQLADKIGTGRCSHIAGGETAEVQFDKETNVLIIDATDVQIKMSFDEAQKIMKELRKGPDKLPGVVEVDKAPEPKAGSLSRKLKK